MAKRGARVPEGVTEREKEMAVALAEARRRGEEVPALAARLGISVETVKWWAWRIRARGRAKRVPPARGASPPRFVEVRLPESRPGGFEVVLGGGRTLRVPSGFDAGELGRLVRALEATC